MEVAERCTKKGWPDKKADVERVFRLQALYIEREALRFDYVFSKGAVAEATFNSLSRIHERLGTNWTDADEIGLGGQTPAYQGIATEIAQLLASWDVNCVDGPLRDVKRDAEYLAAEKSLGIRTRELNALLSSACRVESGE
jgi:hypothetical protein